jgi:DNA-binding CsgD family transcriptional regulator
MNGGLNELTEREKDVLRLLAASHDAKSAAAELGLSVHTINERLRAARRKLGVSSSRAAARLLAEAESPVPKSLVDKNFGGDPTPPVVNRALPPARRLTAPKRWLTGGLMMSVVALILVIALTGRPGMVPESRPETPLPKSAVTPDHASPASGETIASAPAAPLESPNPPPTTTLRAEGPQVAPPDAAARAMAWLALVDQGDWNQSWRAASPTFQNRMSQDAWAARASRMNRPHGPLERVQQYAVRSASPAGSEAVGSVLVQYQATASTGARLLETVALVPDGDTWRVSAYFAHESPAQAPRPAP